MIRFAKPFVAPLSILALLAVGLHPVAADTIAGPSAFTVVGANDTLWGIQFTALQNATLTSFDYNHRDNTFGNLFSGTISLNDVTTSMTAYTSPYGTNLPSVVPFTGLNVPLHSGDIYQLVATSDVFFGTNDEVFQYNVLNVPPITYPESDSDISVTSGVFDNNPGFQVNNAWGAFTNITTSHVPEPGAYVFLSSFILTAVAALRRRGKAARSNDAK